MGLMQSVFNTPYIAFFILLIEACIFYFYTASVYIHARDTKNDFEFSLLPRPTMPSTKQCMYLQNKLKMSPEQKNAPES